MFWNLNIVLQFPVRYTGYTIESKNLPNAHSPCLKELFYSLFVNILFVIVVVQNSINLGSIILVRVDGNIY